jgi:hypothetical protein
VFSAGERRRSSPTDEILRQDLGCGQRPCKVGPAVRIRFAPAGSLVRTTTAGTALLRSPDARGGFRGHIAVDSTYTFCPYRAGGPYPIIRSDVVVLLGLRHFGWLLRHR